MKSILIQKKLNIMNKNVNNFRIKGKFLHLVIQIAPKLQMLKIRCSCLASKGQWILIKQVIVNLHPTSSSKFHSLTTLVPYVGTY